METPQKTTYFIRQKTHERQFAFLTNYVEFCGEIGLKQKLYQVYNHECEE